MGSWEVDLTTGIKIGRDLRQKRVGDPHLGRAHEHRLVVERATGRRRAVGLGRNHHHYIVVDLDFNRSLDV